MAAVIFAISLCSVLLKAIACTHCSLALSICSVIHESFPVIYKIDLHHIIYNKNHPLYHLSLILKLPLKANKLTSVSNDKIIRTNSNVFDLP